MATQDYRKGKSSENRRRPTKRRRACTSSHHAKADISTPSRLPAPSSAKSVRVHVIVVRDSPAGHVNPARVAMNDNFFGGPSDARSQ
jgi:hypothetical protein